MLSNYLGNMSMTHIPVIVNTTSLPAGNILAVGHGAAMLLTSGRIAPELATLDNDSFVLSHNRSGIRPGSFVVAGAKASQRGDLTRTNTHTSEATHHAVRADCHEALV